MPTSANYYELALRIIGAYIDGQKAHDVFLLEQDGSFVVRLYDVSGSRGGSPAVANSRATRCWL